MDDLDDIIDAGEKTGFFSALKRELAATGELYLGVIKHPSILAKGVYQLIRDLAYETPKSLKSLIQGNFRHENLETRLKENHSQALAVSEAASIPGTYAGVLLFNMFGADDYTSSIIGGSIGNYASAVAAFILAYNILTRGDERYSVKDALIQSCRCVKDSFAPAMALYLSEAPAVSGLLATGLPRNLAVGLNLAVGMAIFVGVSKYSASKNIKCRKQENRVD